MTEQKTKVATETPLDCRVSWWRWPENKRTGRVPWFVILRRLTFWLPLAVGLVLAYLAIMGGYGRREARKWLKDAI